MIPVLVLCVECAATLDQEVGRLNLGPDDAARVRADVLGTIGTFVVLSGSPLPEGQCFMCALKAHCTCGKGDACGYNKWAAMAVASAHNHLFGGASA